MSTPSFFSFLQALTFANLVCALPSAIVSLTNRSWMPLLTFLVLVQLHGLLLGIPAFRFLWSRDAINALSSVGVGAVAGALPSAVLLAGASGPGVRYFQTVSLAALSGAAVAFASWLLLTRAGRAEEERVARAGNASSPRKAGSPGARAVTGGSLGHAGGKPGAQRSPAMESLLRAIEAKRPSDPLIGARVGGKEIFERLLSAMKDDRGVHVGSLLCALGSLAGYACQASVRAQALASGVKQDALLVARGADGKRYLFGDALNQPLAEAKYSVWSLAAGAAKHNGCERLPDIGEIFTHVAETVGTAAFGVPRFPEGHNAGDLPINYLKSMWPVLFPVAKLFCKEPREWPLLFGFALQEALDAGKQAVAQDVALRIVMEAAVPMSKVDLETA